MYIAKKLGVIFLLLALFAVGACQKQEITANRNSPDSYQYTIEEYFNWYGRFFHDSDDFFHRSYDEDIDTRLTLHIAASNWANKLINDVESINPPDELKKLHKALLAVYSEIQSFISDINVNEVDLMGFYDPSIYFVWAFESQEVKTKIAAYLELSEELGYDTEILILNFS